MSALNIISVGHAIHLFADYAIYDGDGILQELRPKLFSYGRAHTIVGVSGPVPLIEFLSNAPDTDCSQTILMHCYAGACAAAEHDRRGSLKIFVCSFIAGRLHCWKIETQVGITKPSVEELSEGCWSFSPRLSRAFELSPIFQQALLVGLNLKSPQSIGMLALEDQRKHSLTIPGWASDEPRYIVGGAAHTISINGEKIKNKILRRWPDKIGQHINP